MNTVQLRLCDRASMARAQRLVAACHYLRRPVDPRATPEGYEVCVAGADVGVLIVGRPEATRCFPWYGSVADLESGRAEVTRWQVLNLARVWVVPEAQPGGVLHEAAARRAAAGQPSLLPGFIDRRGHWRSTLASTAIAALADWRRLVLTVADVQAIVARVWTLDGYGPAFCACTLPTRDFGHALGHVQKAAGRLFEVVDAYDHGRPEEPPAIGKYLADLVICAARLASTAPGGAVDLVAVVRARLAEISERAPSGTGKVGRGPR